MSHQSYTVDAAECAQRQRNRWAFDGTTSLTTNDGRLTGQGALISDRDQLCYRTISEMFQSNFQLARKEICIPGHDLLVPEERSTGKRNNSAFLASILAGKLPISRFLINYRLTRDPE